MHMLVVVPINRVSTHSRAEAAAVEVIAPTKRDYRFNTQPRGGGCLHRVF